MARVVKLSARVDPALDRGGPFRSVLAFFFLRPVGKSWLAVLLPVQFSPAVLALDPSVPPGLNFDLSHWYLTLPDANASQISPTNLSSGYTNAAWFYTGPDGAMVFWCPVTGGTTPNSSYPRSELRELINPPDYDANWLSSER